MEKGLSSRYIGFDTALTIYIGSPNEKKLSWMSLWDMKLLLREYTKN